MLLLQRLIFGTSPTVFLFILYWIFFFRGSRKSLLICIQVVRKNPARCTIAAIANPRHAIIPVPGKTIRAVKKESLLSCVRDLVLLWQSRKEARESLFWLAADACLEM
jgi:hypothetical protein